MQVEAARDSNAGFARSEDTIAELWTHYAADTAFMQDSHRRVIRGDRAITADSGRLASREVAVGDFAKASRQEIDAYIVLAVDVAKRECEVALQAFIARHSSDCAACQGREEALKAPIDATSKKFDGIITQASGFMTDLREKNKLRRVPSMR